MKEDKEFLNRMNGYYAAMRDMITQLNEINRDAIKSLEELERRIKEAGL